MRHSNKPEEWDSQGHAEGSQHGTLQFQGRNRSKERQISLLNKEQLQGRRGSAVLLGSPESGCLAEKRLLTTGGQADSWQKGSSQCWPPEKATWKSTFPLLPAITETDGNETRGYKMDMVLTFRENSSSELSKLNAGCGHEPHGFPKGCREPREGTPH